MKHLWEVGEEVTLCEVQIHWGRDKVVPELFNVEEVRDESTAVQHGSCSDCARKLRGASGLRQDALTVVSLRGRGTNLRPAGFHLLTT
jgi:hypothetical protein